MVILAQGGTRADIHRQGRKEALSGRRLFLRLKGWAGKEEAYGFDTFF